MEIPKISFRWNSEVVDVLGQDKVGGVVVRDVDTRLESTLDAEHHLAALADETDHGTTRPPQDRDGRSRGSLSAGLVRSSMIPAGTRPEEFALRGATKTVTDSIPDVISRTMTAQPPGAGESTGDACSHGGASDALVAGTNAHVPLQIV